MHLSSLSLSRSFYVLLFLYLSPSPAPPRLSLSLLASLSLSPSLSLSGFVQIQPDALAMIISCYFSLLIYLYSNDLRILYSSKYFVTRSLASFYGIFIYISLGQSKYDTRDELNRNCEQQKQNYSKILIFSKKYITMQLAKCTERTAC